MKTDDRRRRLVLGMAGLLLAGPALATRLAPTPDQMAGPFYPLEPPAEDDSDLTRVRGAVAPAQGRVTDLRGRILDLDGRPIRNARVEIWQCDARGRYHHPHDMGPPPDPGFQGFGHSMTDAEGRYRFRTIRPVPYPGRTPHIHYAVHVPGQRPFTTQLYVAGEPRNADDFLFRAIPAERRGRVQAEFLPGRGGGAELSASFDIVLGGRGGTPRS
ncbi:MAG: protocatechuate 3,4-dioxygenase subunit beta [Thiobacillaceae bacterium]|jgi:protocatechuate 3,4-dioxygenase beta subunit|nr:protocatechuate 3,4-dioxygenase subunit beta [Thiobacillaceae bacterium]